MELAIAEVKKVLDDVGPTLDSVQAQARAECRRIVERVEVCCPFLAHATIDVCFLCVG